jgi:hypothetical protein
MELIRVLNTFLSKLECTVGQTISGITEKSLEMGKFENAVIAAIFRPQGLYA